MTLSRPAAKNALGRVLLGQLKDTVDTLRFDPSVRVVVLRSAVDKACSAHLLHPLTGKHTRPRASAKMPQLRLPCDCMVRRLMREFGVYWSLQHERKRTHVYRSV